MVKTSEKYEFHEYCLLFQQADERTLSDMADDIIKNGLNDAIVLYEGKILDGRNRYLACLMADAEMRFEEYRGDEALQYAISKNLHRRHLTEAQRADVAARVHTMSSGIPIGEVAKQFNVSETSVQKAEKIRAIASDKIKQAVAEGKASINRAVKTLKEAERQTGIKVGDNTSAEDKKRVHAAQDAIDAAIPERSKPGKRSILTEDAPAPKPDKSTSAKEFNDKVLSGVFDGSRFRKNMAKIQAIITEMEQVPALYNDAYEMIQTLEQTKAFNMAVGAVIDAVKKAETMLRSDDTDFKKVQQALKALQADRFKIDPYVEDDKREVLEVIMQKFFDDADAYVRQAQDIRNDLLKREQAAQ